MTHKMPYYSLQLTFRESVAEEEEQLLEYLQELGISFLEVLCNDLVSNPTFEAMVFSTAAFGPLQGRISIQTSCPVPDEAWLACTAPLSLDLKLEKAEIATQVGTTLGPWTNLPL